MEREGRKKNNVYVISVNPLRTTAMYKNIRAYTTLVCQFGSVFHCEIISQVVELCQDTTS